MRGVRFGGRLHSPGRALVCPLRRVRDVSRSKPRPEAVGGSRKSAGEVDESETGSANERASFGRLFHSGKVLALCPGADRCARRDCELRSAADGGRVCRVLACTCARLRSTTGVQAFIWALVFFLFLWFGMLAVGVSGRDGVRPRARARRADLPLRADPRRRRPRSAAPLASLSAPDQTRSALRGAACSRLRACTSRPASSAPTRSSRRACAGVVSADRRTSAPTRAPEGGSRPSAPMCRFRSHVADWSSARPGAGGDPSNEDGSRLLGEGGSPGDAYERTTVSSRSRVIGSVRVGVGRGRAARSAPGAGASRRRGVEAEAEDEPEPEREHRQQIAAHVLHEAVDAEVVRPVRHVAAAQRRVRLVEDEDPAHRDRASARTRAGRRSARSVGLPHFVQPPSSCESAITSPAPARIP